MIPYNPYTYRQLPQYQSYQTTGTQLVAIPPSILELIPLRLRRRVPPIPSELAPYVTPQVIARIISQAEGNPLEDCGDFCIKECGWGNPICYGACYWHCVIWGGPPTEVTEPEILQPQPLQPYPYQPFGGRYLR
ncbi:hypothetical protein JMM81_10670 [Bacillus sp. V3B]|uniref:hypothetical protein n=1 Tax=Bacillus sp. V3B TaxID=2804915 RepID=UPI00210C6E0B|nr:hypothetical protein [Bacillus sp. V3B]MCQ6275422.1 hypothetical protein [Bacillus sp. V3B]